MKFRCERDRLVEALGAAGRAVANRGGSLPVLSGVRAELTGNQLKLTGSDLELTIETRIEVAGERDGVAVLPSKIALDVVKSLGDPRVEISCEADEATIVAVVDARTMQPLAELQMPQIVPFGFHAAYSAT